MTFAAAARDRVLAAPYVARCKTELAQVEAEIAQVTADGLLAYLAEDNAEGDRLSATLPYLHHARQEWQARIARNT